MTQNILKSSIGPQFKEMMEVNGCNEGQIKKNKIHLLKNR
jgi:ribosomal protein L21